MLPKKQSDSLIIKKNTPAERVNFLNKYDTYFMQYLIAMIIIIIIIIILSAWTKTIKTFFFILNKAEIKSNINMRWKT